MNKNYKNSCIYFIYSDKEPQIYVGSTTDFNKRKGIHKYDCTNSSSRYYNRPLYKFIRTHGGWNNWNMIVIRPYPCNSKEELETEELSWIKCCGSCCLNNRQPTRTKEQYYVDNKDKISNYKKQWYLDNQYKINNRRKQYYKDNKDNISKKRKNQKIECVCGSRYRKVDKARHERTIKHQKFINN